MDEGSLSLSTDNVRHSTKLLYSSFSPRFLSGVSLGPPFGTFALEKQIPLWGKPVWYTDLDFLQQRASYVNEFPCLNYESVTTIDPRLLTRDGSEEIEDFEHLLGFQVGSSWDFPLTIDDEFSDDEENVSSNDTEITEVLDVSPLERLHTNGFSIPLVFESTKSSDLNEKDAIDINEILRQTPVRDLTPYLSTPPKTLSHSLSPGRQSSSSPPIRSLLRSNNPPSPPLTANSGTPPLNCLTSPPYSTFHVSFTEVPLEDDERLPPTSAETPHSQHDTITSQSDEEYQYREISSSLSPPPNDFQRRTPPPLKIFDSVTVERSPGPAVKNNFIRQLKQSSQMAQPTFTEEKQQTLTDDDMWVPGAGKSPKSLNLLRKKMKRQHPEDFVTQGAKRRRLSRFNENLEIKPYKPKQSTSETQTEYTSWTPEEYSLLQQLRDSPRPVPWREVVNLLNRDLRDVKTTWKAREEWLHSLPRQLTQWGQEKMNRLKALSDEYDRMKWNVIASELGTGWEECERMAREMGLI